MISKHFFIFFIPGARRRANAAPFRRAVWEYLLTIPYGRTVTYGEIARAVGGEYPAVLLDDVFSELDENRRRYILDALDAEEGESASSRQIIITSCEPDVIPGARASRVSFRRVENGKILEGGG